METIISENIFDLNSYNYSLPTELIAQYPCEKRDESKLLCYKRERTEISHHRFYELSDMLGENDVLVLNNTKVLQARFYAKVENNKEIEILFVNPISSDNLTWKILASPKKRLRGVETLHAMSLSPINIIDPETIRFNSHKDLELILNQIGEMPLPPYIKRPVGACRDLPNQNDFERYQTVFAKIPGAVAAPTASLHFTEELLKKIQNKGVEILYITLHVGPGTFLPIRTENIREHKLMPEKFSIEQETWNKILQAKKNKKRIIACGTTTVRTLEYLSLLEASNRTSLQGLNDLYITPGFKFQIVDGIITNFHLPKTSLLVLVSAFIGWENLKPIYENAMKEKYRFFSYGDGMFIY